MELVLAHYAEISLENIRFFTSHFNIVEFSLYFIPRECGEHFMHIENDSLRIRAYQKGHFGKQLFSVIELMHSFLRLDAELDEDIRLTVIAKYILFDKLATDIIHSAFPSPEGLFRSIRFEWFFILDISVEVVR
jgi:hypothetical protein